MAIFIVAAYAVASESSGNDYEGVSQDDKGCKSQTLNSLNESYVSDSASALGRQSGLRR